MARPLNRSLARTVVALGTVAISAGALAVEPDEILPDAALEARARAISSELRCLVCQNQSIDDSNAPLAKDLRVIVRERLTAGASDAEVRRFVVDRYGSFVLLKPPLTAGTLLLWLTPLLILLAAAAALWRQFWRQTGRAAAAPTALTKDESRRLSELMGQDGPSKHGTDGRLKR